MKSKLALLAALALLFSGATLAREHFTDFGRVLHAQPVYEYKIVRTDRDRHCRDNYRPDRHYYRRSESHSHAPAIGAVVGGLIGNRLGHGDTRILTTVAGSIAGAAIASNHSENHYRHGNKNKHQTKKHKHYPDRHCETRHSSRHKRRVLKGYDVTYRYKGEIFHTFTREHPGRRIRLDVSIKPLEY